tara:strand:+ start:410 stop:757 length:348 start_codon:yes stop_codon:yes gene_type:complete
MADSTNYNGVQAFRLLSGEDVFGTVKHFDENSFYEKPFIELSNAAVISMRMDEKTKQPMVGFAPFSPFGTSKDVSIRSDKVTMTYTPKTEIANAYQQTLGSGLIKPTGPLPNLKR